MTLTDGQKRAAEAAGSVSVTAGAGTGKTRMLASRFLHHVAVDKFRPLSIVAVTFTDKAADELRARIRKTVLEELSDDSTAAEIEAAQISTIHALANRICRDFYDLAGIPADFSVMDDTESPLWFAEKLEEAVGRVDPAVIREFGYTRFIEAMTQLLKDPFAADEAFKRTPAEWEAEISAIGGPALDEFKRTPAWLAAVETVDSVRGDEGDKLETARRIASAAVRDIQLGQNIAASLLALSDLKAGQGSAKAWPPGGKAVMAACLLTLIETAAQYLPTAGMQFGPDDIEVARRAAILRPVYEQIRDILRAEKRRERVLDYNDLEHYALEVLKHDEALEHYAERWKAFLIDEFQDTNPVQAEILQRLTRNARQTIVGDEKQSIYGFRRADVEVFGRFREAIRRDGGGEEKLDRTFRAHAELVDKMNLVFEPLLEAMHQPLRAERSAAFSPRPHFVLNTVADAEAVKRELQFVEARHIAEQISQMLDSGMPVHDGRGGQRPVEPKDIAILSRTWGPMDVYSDALAATNVPAVHAGGGSLLTTREFKDAYALLSFLADPNDDVAFVTVLRSPFFACSDKLLYRFACKMPPKTSWWAATANDPGELADASAILGDLFKLRPHRSAAGLLLTADSMTGYRAVIANLPHGSRREADWRGTIAYLQKIESRGNADVFATARHLKKLVEAEIEVPRPPLDASQSVSLMTIHKSKGLEWPVVFVADLAKERNKSDSRLQIDAETGIAFCLEDEHGETVKPAIFNLIKQKREARENAEARRLMYVAITRAGERVFLTATAQKGPYLDLLQPGLEAAGIANEPIEFDPSHAVPPSPGQPASLAAPTAAFLDAVHVGLNSLPVTALTTYSECALKFKFRFIDGHPGLGEGSPDAATIGKLAHKALEMDLSDPQKLRAYDLGAAAEHLAEALRLAENFRSMPEFSAVRVGGTEKEKRFRANVQGLLLEGIVDVVGPDFVLDYKTDSVPDPETHRFQLWAYARAFDKPRALIAYLRHGTIHEFGPDSLAALDGEAEILIGRIKKGDSAAGASQKVCGRCNYSLVCDSRFVEESIV